MIYNKVLRYIADNLKDMQETIDCVLSSMNRYRLPLNQADSGDKIENAILSAIDDFEVDNDFEKEEILDRLLAENDMEDIFFDALNLLDKDVNEGYNTVQWQHFDNHKNRYESYVLINNSDMSIVYNYNVYPGDFWRDVLEEAIEDAKDYVEKNKYGSYSVYGCLDNEYDETTLIFNTDDINETINENNNFNEYIDKDGHRHKKFIDEDTGEEIDIDLDDEYFKNKSKDSQDFKVEIIEDDTDDEYFKHLVQEEIALEQEIKYYSKMKDAYMRDMENDERVFLDPDGPVAQRYGEKLGEIDEILDGLYADYEYLRKGLDNSDIKINNKDMNDKQILETLVKKYGKDTILNELKAETYFSAAEKAEQLGRPKQAEKFTDAMYKQTVKDYYMNAYFVNEDQLFSLYTLNAYDDVFGIALCDDVNNRIWYLTDQDTQDMGIALFKTNKAFRNYNKIQHYEYPEDFCDEIISEKQKLSKPLARDLVKVLKDYMEGSPAFDKKYFDWHLYTNL